MYLLTFCKSCQHPITFKNDIKTEVNNLTNDDKNNLSSKRGVCL